jgi:hypothetical protein
MKRLKFKVIPNAKQSKIIEEGDNIRAYVTEPAKEGKANKALIDLLAKHFGIKKSNLKIIHGEKARAKTVEIDT